MKKKKQWIISYVYYALIASLIIGVFYITYRWLIPCLISIFIVMALQPLISNILKVLRLENKVALLIVTVIVYLIIIGLVVYLVFLGMIQCYLLLEKLPGYVNTTYEFIKNSPVATYLDAYTDVFYESVNDVIQNCSTSFIDYLITFIARIPSLTFDGMFIVISSLFFILDYKNIKQVLLQVSRHENVVRNVVGCIKEVISSVFRAYLSIFMATFIALLVAFYIIGINDALMLAFTISFFDFLPILGLDMIFIPWIVMMAFQNQMSLALRLLIVYIIVNVMKNVLEPKLLSKHIGMHPLLTIVSMFIGAKLLGILGMIFVPLLIMIGKRLYELYKGEML